MPADVEAVPAIVGRASQPTYLLAGFEHGGCDSALGQFIGCRKPRRSRTDNDNGFLAHRVTLTVNLSGAAPKRRETRVSLGHGHG